MRKLNKVLILLVANLLLIGNISYASFPVQSKANQNESVSATSAAVDADAQDSEKLSFLEKIKSNLPDGDATMTLLILLALWFFLGWPFAAHRWYGRRSIGWTILFILTFGGFGLWLLIDLIMILMGDYKK